MREVSQTGDDSIMAGPSAVRRSLSVHFPWGGKAQGGSIRTYYILACSVLYLERTWICTVDGHCHGLHKIKMCARRQAHCCTRARTQCAHTRWYIRTQKLNCHRFQTLPACDLISLSSSIGSYLCGKCLKAVTILFVATRARMHARTNVHMHFIIGQCWSV